MRVLVCGSRTYENDHAVWTVLTGLNTLYGSEGESIELVCGMARGADMLAYNWAMTQDVYVHEFPADWENHGNSAGPRRNRKMLVEGQPDLVIAFYEGEVTKGTNNMIHQAVKAGIPVWRVVT